MKSGAWTRMVLAFAAILVVGGSGLALAAGPLATYAVPKSSVILGPSTVARSGAANYILEVTAADGTVGDYGIVGGVTQTGATFSSVSSVGGTINASTGAYTAPATGGIDKISASFTQQGVTTSASRFIRLQ